MKPVRGLSAAAAGLVLAVVGAGSAGAGGTTDVSIMLQAQYVTEVVVSVALHVTCEGDPLFGVVDVTVEQEPPETQSTTVGTGEQVVVCDGSARRGRERHRRELQRLRHRQGLRDRDPRRPLRHRYGCEADHHRVLSSNRAGADWTIEGCARSSRIYGAKWRSRAHRPRWPAAPPRGLDAGGRVARLPPLPGPSGV